MSTLVAQQPERHVNVAALPLQHGGVLRDARIAYSSYGAHNAAVVVLGGISGGRHVVGTPAHAGWWPGVIGADAGLDPSVFRLIGMDYLGGRGASSQPVAGECWRLSTGDQAAALLAVLEDLGVERLHAIVGASLGGMVALAFAARYPDRVERIITLGAAHRPHPFTTALRSVQRRIVRLGAQRGVPRDGVALARALAVTTYRTAEEFGDRFSGEPILHDGAASFPVDAYLEHHGALYADSFAAESYLTISQCLDLHDVDPRDVRTPCHLIGFDTDTLVPLHDIRGLAAALGDRARLVIIPTRYGHDGFLKEHIAVSDAIRSALSETQPLALRTAGLPPSQAADKSAPTHYASRACPDPATRAAATIAARAGIGADLQHGAVIAPIHMSSTFTFQGLSGKRQYDYTRSGNPTRGLLAATVAELESAAAGVITATGMAAITVVLQLLKPGDLLMAAHDAYGGTYRLLRALARRHPFDIALVDLTDGCAGAAIRTRRPRMVWIESPSNPLLRITDIASVARAAHDVGGLCVVDNTFLSPALQQPIALGADIVVHSTTKYLNGHSDVVGGAVVANDVALAEEIGWWANCIGATGAPFDSYLTLRGLRTLNARMRVHEENAHAIVDLLQAHPAVRRLHYPGLSTHPGHGIAARQQRGFGAMVSFEIDGNVGRFVDALRWFSLAESLGGVESLIAHPATMTHAAMDPEARMSAGITDTLLRISVGIEDRNDLLRDLSGALVRVEARLTPGPSALELISAPRHSAGKQ